MHQPIVVFFLTAWNFESSFLTSDSIMPEQISEVVKKDTDAHIGTPNDRKVYIKMKDEKKLGNPVIVGKTRWLDYLQETPNWNAHFWQLISPANFHRLLTQKKITERMCKALGIDDNEFRVQGASMHVIKKDTIDDHFEQHSSTDYGSCSLALVIARLEGTKFVKQEALLRLLTEDYQEPHEGENNAGGIPSAEEIAPDFEILKEVAFGDTDDLGEDDMTSLKTSTSILMNQDMMEDDKSYRGAVATSNTDANETSDVPTAAIASDYDEEEEEED